MAWNLKSDKTGKVYTFADDVDQESALKYMDDVLEKPATWQEVLSQRTIEGQVRRGAVGALAGIRQIGEDLGLAEPGQAADVREEMRREAEKELPKNMSITQQGVLGGLSALPEMALTLLPGVGVATKAISTAQGLRAGLGVAGGLEGLREYGEQRDYGHGPARSAVHSGVAGAAEIIGERLPLGYVFDRFGKEGAGKFIANVLGRDVVGEEITYLIQSANEKLSRNPDMTLGEFLEGAGVTAVAAVTGGGLMGGALAGVDAGAKKLGEYRMRKSIERAFAGLNEVPTLPDAQPLRPETEGRPSADLTTQLEAFKEQNISTDLWSDVGRKYMPSFAPEQLVKTAEPTAVREALDTYLTLSPTRAADFVVANLPVIAESGVDLQTFVADKVNKGELTATKANAAITAITQKVDAVTSGLRQAQLKLAETSDLEEADFTTAEDQKFREAVGGSEIRLWADAYNALHGDARLGREHLSQADFTAAGIPQAQAEYLETLDASGQRTIVSENRGLLSTLLGDTSRSAPRTAATVVGDFPFYKQFVEPQTAVHKDRIGRRVTFGPAKGAVVQNTTILDFKSGEVNVVPGIYDANAPSDLSTVERRMAAITRQWVRKYAPGMSVVLRVSSNANSRYGGRHYMGGADGGKTVHFIDVNVGQKSGDLAEIIQTLSHEFGHALFTRQFYLATPEMRETLRKQWVKEMFVDKFDQTAADIVKGNRPGGYVGALDSPMRRLLTRQLTRSVNSPTSSTNRSLDYWTNFMEWHAHMMERMLVADYRDMQAPVRRYWKEAFARIKKFFAAEHTKWAPNQTIDQWLKLMARREEAVQTEMQRYDFMDAALKTNAPFMSPDYMEPKEVAQGNDAQIIPDNMRMESPTPPPIDASDVAPAMRDFPEAIDYVKRAFKKADPTNGPQVTESLVKFNRTWAFLLGSFQVLGLNKDVPGATRFLNALRAKFGYKSEWLRSSNITANRWEGLGKERAGTLAKLLMTEAETDTWFSERMDDPKRPGHYIFVLDEAKAKEFKIDDEMAEVYSEVRDNYMRALDAMETLGRERLVRQFADDPSNPQMDAQLRELEASYANMRDKPYTPFSRFGQFYAKIRAKENGIFRDPITGHPKFYTAGQTVYFETFETAADRDAAMPALRKKYGSDPMLEAQFNTGKIHDIVYSVRNLPPQFIRSIADRLGLTAEQLQEYNEIVKDLAADTSFVKHMKRKANISGYSPDALRGFADYFLRFANNYAKGKSAPELEAAMADVRQYKRELEQRVEDTTKLDEFYNWLQRTHDYVMNPGNEFAEFKSFVTAWYLGFNIPTAAQNITQLPFWTLPYLSKRFGMAKSMATMKTALNDVLHGWKNLDRLTADEKAMMTHALEQGFIDESFATSVAQFAEGTALTRLTATATRHRVLNWYNHKSLWMFQKAEEINRRTSLLAAYRLNRKDGFAGAYDADAFLAARETVEVTQNEYALENRPEFMRGKASVIFQFLHYVQNAIFRMTPWGDDSWKRLLLMQLAVAGLMGLPFAEDLLNAAKFLARRFGIHFEPELEMRQLLMELNVAPDWVLRGAAAHLGPFDLSFRYSLGKVIPGMEALASNQRFTEALANGVGDVGGAGASVVINAMRAMYELEHNPDKLKAMQYTTPTFVKYGMQAMSAAEEGGVIARNGALIAPLDQGEILGMSIGLQPKSKMHAYEKVGYEVEARNYWMARRATLLAAIYHARRTGDREALADTMKHLREYNAEARRVDRSLVVTAQTLQRSVANRGKVAAQQEVWGSPYKNPELTRGIQSGYSE